ncbi:MAG: DUF4254 domain-containing protein, partial [Mucinivorans sp.]
MKFTDLCDQVFQDSIDRYHVSNDVDAPMATPYAAGSIEMLLFHKNWIDTVQWHLEDIIRDPMIDPIQALQIKRRIDASNQDRTDKVEFLDNYFLDKYKGVTLSKEATLNSETVAWALDRLSILALKIYHMRIEATRNESSAEQRTACAAKLAVLDEQHTDLTGAINDLLADIEAGRKFIKTYKQMKMYNDPALNPVLYKK